MHEVGIVQEIITSVISIAKDNALKTIDSVTIRIGELRQIVPETFEFVFDALKKGTLLEKASINVIYVPLKLVCNECNCESGVSNNIFACSQCESGNVSIIEGKELLLESIEGDTDGD